MANLLRFVPRTKDLILPDGELVKVEVNDTCTVQHVHDSAGRVHGTARPATVVLQLRRSGEQVAPAGATPYKWDDDVRLWAPLHPDKERG